MVKKMQKLTNKKVQLILTKKPKLIYVDPASDFQVISFSLHPIPLFLRLYEIGTLFLNYIHQFFSELWSNVDVSVLVEPYILMLISIVMFMKLFLICHFVS